MATQSTKRPTCPSCSKPTRMCLCNRLRAPTLHNSVAVTILQHSLEKNHPLNSTRIATIGLENVDVFTVSDVNFQARFFLQLVDDSYHLFDEMSSKEKNDEFLEMTNFENRASVADNTDLDRQITDGIDFKNAIDFSIAKYGAITSFDIKMGPNKCQQMRLDQLLASDIALDQIRKGFVVKKINEFEIAVPPGSVLLFPSETSVDVEAINLEVKNLIVLDGTWAKAKRMYNENPWLRLLPHLRLDIDKLSLYSEVRRQPRAGYLSTIESIVYAMKAVGEDSDGLDGLLDVFESMVGDQRRCKDERLSRVVEK
ncbi:hypothetical protein ACS0TY_032744 [Phlomoides rotata]